MKKITEKILYEDYCLDNPKTTLTYEQWYKIIEAFCQLVLENILFRNKVFMFPGALFGFIALIRSKNYRARAVHTVAASDNENMKALLKTTFNTPMPLDRIRTYWDKRRKYNNFYRNRFYDFKWDKQFRRKIHEYIVKSMSDPDMVSIDVPLKRV